MLDLSKMEFENTQFSGKKFDLRDLLRDVAMEASPLFTERKLSFEVETGTGPVSVLGDSSKLRRALLNIVSNAAKFTPPGGSVVCKTFETSERKGICVRDTGIGIRKDDFGKIFEKFGQGENVLTRETVGSGLGLSIAKEIVERSGGRIEMTSEVGKGSEFCILFP